MNPDIVQIGREVYDELRAAAAQLADAERRLKRIRELQSDIYQGLLNLNGGWEVIDELRDLLAEGRG